MCGISAIVKSSEKKLPFGALQKMTDTIAHRGPDGQGVLYGLIDSGKSDLNVNEPSNWQIGLGHRRLSILDLSEASNQPLSYNSGQLQVVFNGEIYNYLEIKEDLIKNGFSFKTTGDTEVILAAYLAYGKDCFSRFNGMFTVVIWDIRNQEIVVCRDRMGIKPLYYIHEGNFWAFASEIKQLTHLPDFRSKFNKNAVYGYLSSGYEYTDRSMFKNVMPVPPGHFGVISLPDNQMNGFHSYWKPRVEYTVTDPREAGELFGKAFKKSVGLYLRSDVPVGSELSGGMDSSSITVEMKSQYQGKGLHTFTTTFPNYEHDESEYAQAIIDQVGATAYFDTPTAEQFKNEFDKFIYQHDEPVGSMTMFANYSLARAIRKQGIKVVLNGQGGDELLGGYWQSYFSFLRNTLKQRNPSLFLRNVLGASLPEGNEQLIGMAMRMAQRYRSRVKENNHISFVMDVPDEDQGQVNKYLQLNEAERRLWDVRNLLLPRLLKWDDRNLMSFGVEGRYPLLDHNLIEACFSFSTSTLYSSGWTKMPMRRALKASLPPKVLNRKKKLGYVTPQEQWMFNDFRPELEKWLINDNPIWDVLEKNSFQNIAKNFWKNPQNANAKRGFHNENGLLIFRAYALDTWLRTFNLSP